MEKKAGKNPRRSIAKDLNEVPKIPTPEEFQKRVDDFIDADRAAAIDEFVNETVPPTQEETGSLVDGGVQRIGFGDSHLVSEETDRMLFEIGRRLGEEGFIFVGGLIPYKTIDIGGKGWEMDTERDPIRITNINEAKSVRVTMGLFAYLIESMQGDLSAELGLEAKTKGQVPS